MKKFKNFAYVGAIALLSVVGFTACSSSDDTALDPKPNPTYDGESVKTQFTISLPEAISGMRMAAATVQETGNPFRGIDNIKLVPYSLGADAEDGVQGTETANANLISLSPLSAFDHTQSNSKVYADVSLLVGTSNFLFYGKAIDNTAGTAIETAADKFKFGTLNDAGLSGQPTLNEVSFTPVPIYSSEDVDAIGTNLIAALNAVAQATPKEYDGDNLINANLTGESAATEFRNVTEEQSHSIHELFTRFSSLKTGSSNNVEFLFSDLYMRLDGMVTDAAKITAPNAYKMALGIRNEIAKYCVIKENGTVTTAINGTNTTSVTLKTGLAAEITGYPANINLPDGAARVTYEEGAFVAATDVTYASSMNVAYLNRYIYPANLQYFVNSPVKVSDDVQSPNYGTKAWSGEGGVLDLYTNGTAVTADTRSVAITNQVQYGVARLDANVKELLSNATTNKYKDYNGDEVDVTSGFTLTGVLIGGQNPVGWDFKKKGDAIYTIYDNTIPGGADAKVVRATEATPGIAVTNYTLVLQTGEETTDKTINVALEFVNNCADFVGANGEVIHHGATFYLVGTLNAANGTKQEGASDDVTKRIFTQDCTTIATFSIKLGTNNNGSAAGDEEGLGTATKGLPDLRTPWMELGLSVNLQWQPGLQFTVDF
ncbi:MAG: hypothetical protein IKZ62_00535 [Prevotella sp.]|nr:hypothetical protein [Prevotella sp.]